MAKFIYTCSICGETYERGNTTCCVAHPLGTCCHYGDKKIEKGDKMEIIKEGTVIFKNGVIAEVRDFSVDNGTLSDLEEYVTKHYKFLRDVK